MNNRSRSTLAIFLIFLVIVVWYYNHHTKQIQWYQNQLEQKNKQIEQILKEKQQLEKESKEYLLRKKANLISGIEIPDKFTGNHIEKVFKECEKYKLPPRVIFRLIKSESNFNKNSLSSQGAKGYLQLMPGTYKAYANKLNIRKHNEYTNLEVGIFYFDTLYDYFGKRFNKKDQLKLAILSYNYGPGVVGNNKKRFLGKEFDTYKYLNFIAS